MTRQPPRLDPPRRIVQIPLTREGRHLLVVESRPNGLLAQLAESVVADLGESHGPVWVSTANDPDSAMTALMQGGYRCVVLDLGMPQDAAAEFLQPPRTNTTPCGKLPILAHHTARSPARRRTCSRAGRTPSRWSACPASTNCANASLCT